MPSTNARRLYELSEEMQRSLHRIADDNSSISYIELESMYKTIMSTFVEQIIKPQQPKRVVRI